MSTGERFQDAERAFSLALQADPTNFDILYNLGLAATRANHLERAQEVFQAALRQRPEDVDSIFGLARVYAQQDKYVQNQVDMLDAGILETENELRDAAADEKAKIQTKLADLRARRDAKVAEIKADFQEDVDEMNAQIDRFKQTLQGKVDETRRKVLERRLAYN